MKKKTIAKIAVPLIILGAIIPSNKDKEPEEQEPIQAEESSEVKENDPIEIGTEIDVPEEPEKHEEPQEVIKLEPETSPVANVEKSTPPQTEQPKQEEPKQEATAPTPAPSPEQAPAPSPSPTTVQQETMIKGRSSNTTVYVSNRSNTIHSVSDCSGMTNYRDMKLGDADAKGYKYCPNCW